MFNVGTAYPLFNSGSFLGYCHSRSCLCLVSIPPQSDWFVMLVMFVLSQLTILLQSASTSCVQNIKKQSSNPVSVKKWETVFKKLLRQLYKVRFKQENFSTTKRFFLLSAHQTAQQCKRRQRPRFRRRSRLRQTSDDQHELCRVVCQLFRSICYEGNPQM